MVDSNKPKLIVLEGQEIESDFRSTLYGLGIEDEDVQILLGDGMTYQDVQYLDNKYPELMGFWATAAAAGVKGLARVGKGIAKISKRIKARKKKAKKAKAAKKASAPKSPAVVKAENVRDMERYSPAAITEGKKFNPMIIGGAIVAAGVLFFMTQKKR